MRIIFWLACAALLPAQSTLIFEVVEGYALAIVKLNVDPSQRRTLFESPDDSLGEDIDAALDRFEAFIRTEPPVYLYSGGRRIGATKLMPDPETESAGCYVLGGKVAGSSTGAHLAATTQIAGRASTRRRANAKEAATLGRLARSWFRGYGVGERFLKGLKSTSIISADLRPGVGRAIIGRFEVEQPDAIFYLIVVGEPGPLGYRITLAETGRYGLEMDKDVVDPEYVDQLDLNADGVDELILRYRYYENWDYGIWQFDGAFWRKVYSGGSAGC